MQNTWPSKTLTRYRNCTLTGLFLALTTLQLDAQMPPSFELKWGANGGDGTSGTGDGEFQGPFDVP